MHMEGGGQGGAQNVSVEAVIECTYTLTVCSYHLKCTPLFQVQCFPQAFQKSEQLCLHCLVTHVQDFKARG